MNFTVIREHREFFRKHHWLECAEVISATDQAKLAEGIPLILAERAEVKSSPSKAFDKNGFAIGHDLWRGRANLKKILLNRSLAGIAGELVEQKPLRFGYDTLFPAVTAYPLENYYESFLQTTPTLEEMSCIQGVLCGAMICISGNREIKEEDQEIEPQIFSRTPGNAVFFAPDWPLPLKEIYQNPGFTYLLIVYVKNNAVYLSQQGDPHVNEFKRLGYSFGDRLNEPFHPIVYT